MGLGTRVIVSVTKISALRAYSIVHLKFHWINTIYYLAENFIAPQNKNLLSRANYFEGNQKHIGNTFAKKNLTQMISIALCSEYLQIIP